MMNDKIKKKDSKNGRLNGQSKCLKTHVPDSSSEDLRPKVLD